LFWELTTLLRLTLRLPSYMHRNWHLPRALPV